MAQANDIPGAVGPAAGDTQGRAGIVAEIEHGPEGRRVNTQHNQSITFVANPQQMRERSISRDKENPGAAATATGAGYMREASQLGEKYSTPWRADAMRRFADPAHKAAARIVGYALTLRNDYGCQAAAFVFRHRLNPEDRAILASAILDSLTDREFAGVIRHFAEGAA